MTFTNEKNLVFLLLLFLTPRLLSSLQILKLALVLALDVFAYGYITNCCGQLFSLLFSILSERGPQLRCLFFQTCFALYPSLKPRSRISLSESALNITSAACYESSAIKMPTFKRSSTSDCNVTPPSIRRREYLTMSNNRVILEYKPL